MRGWCPVRTLLAGPLRRVIMAVPAETPFGGDSERDPGPGVNNWHAAEAGLVGGSVVGVLFISEVRARE